MKKTISVICMAFLFLACSHEEEKTTTDFSTTESLSSSLSQIKSEYNINKEGLTIERFGFGWSGIDRTDSIITLPDTDTLLFVSGRIDGKLWIGCYDKKTKKQYLDWTNPEKLDTVITYNKGYGEYETVVIDSYLIRYPCKNKNKYCFELIGQGNSSPISVHFLYFIDDDKLTKKYSTNYDCKISPWFESVLVQYGSSKLVCYNMMGDSLFTVNDIFPMPIEYKLDRQIPINIEEMIDFDWRGENYPNDPCHFKCVNIRTGETIWEAENLPLNFPDKAKLSDYRIKKSSNVWEYAGNYILYDGTKGTFRILLNIDTGQIELK